MSISAAIIADFKSEVSNTRRVLAAVPGDRFDWKPHEKSMSLGQLASHIAENPTWARGMTTAELDFAAIDKDYKPFVAASTDDLVATFEKNAAAFEQLFEAMSDEQMTANWTMRSGDTVMMSAPRDTAIRSIIIHHCIHHRGQLTVYLRLLDVAVPGTYGPTADDASS